MKKLNVLTRMLLLVALLVGSTSSVWAKDVPYLALTFPDDYNASNHVSNYTSTWTAKTGTFAWSISNFNNNNWNNNWSFIRCGTSSASTATITTSSTIDKAIRYVSVTVDATKNCTSNKLEVASNADFTENLQTITGETLAAGVVRYNITNPAENMYYRLTFEQKKGSNGDTQISQVAYCITSAPDDAEPEAVNTTPKVWDFSSTAAQSAAGTITANSTNTLTATDATSTIKYVAGSNDAYEASSNKGYYIKPNGKSGTSSGKLTNRYFVLNIEESGVLKLTSNSAKPGEYLIYQSSENDVSKATKQASIYTSGDKLTAYGEVDIANGEYVFIGFSAQIYTEKIMWMIPDGISLTTSANMDGWRAFYDATQGYTVDANTKIYKVSKSDVADQVTLETITGGVPAGTPVLLKTSADDHKLILAKATPSVTVGTNLLKATTTVTNLSAGVYRFGYSSADGIGFYPYASATAPAGVVYIETGDVQTSGGANGISFIIADESSNETDGIKSVSTKVENGVRYNLAGQKVGADYKGIIIVNGKKYLNK